MSALLALCVLGAAVWFLVSLAGRAGLTSEPMDSVAQFSRAMGALDPTAAARPAPQPTQADLPPYTPSAPLLVPGSRQPSRPMGAAPRSGWFSAPPSPPRR